jgi:ankyrin repeat protein
VKALVAGGGDPNIRDDGGNTPLHYAAEFSQKTVLEFLLSKGAPVNAKDRGGRTALDDVCLSSFRDSPGGHATPSEYKEMGELLVAKGGEINGNRDRADLVLRFAARYGLRDLAERVLGGGKADMDIRSPDLPHCVPLFPLLGAITYGHRDVALLLIARGADVSVREADGDTPLHEVARQNDQELAEHLLSKGAAINAQNMEGDTPLHEAARLGHRGMVEFLASQGASLDITNARGDTPLHYAAREHKSTVELLLAKGAAINVQNKTGETPLHDAAVRGRKEIVELLLARGADAGAKDNAGRTALDKATQRGHTEIVELLRQSMGRKTR